jgi:predicted nucleic acid-binding protein
MPSRPCATAVANIVIDTNIAAAWYLEEKPEAVQYSSQVMQAILEQDLTICVPPQFEIELGAVLLRYYRNPTSSFKAPEWQRAINDLYVLDIQIHGFLNNFFEVFQAGLEYNLSGYDAVFFHVARMLRCPIASMDAAIIGACQRFNVERFNPV